MLEKLKNMTLGGDDFDAEFLRTHNAWEHLVVKSHNNPDIFAGLGTGKRSDAVQASVYDAMMAEILGEHNAEKSKYRRQRKDARKYKELPEDRKHRRERRKDRLYGYYYGPCIKVAGKPDSLPINHRRSAEAEKIFRADWDAEIEDIIEDLDWAFFDAEYLDEQIGMLERNGLQNGDNYPRWNRLYERLKVVNEVIRKNRFVEEMLNDQFGFQNMNKEDCDND